MRSSSKNGPSLPGPWHRERAARHLRRTLRSGAYRLSPLVQRRVRVEDKERVLYQATPLDAVVIGAAAQWVTARIESFLSDRVFSYRKGRSSVDVLRQLRTYLAMHRQERPDPRTRGLYGVKRDISAYGESIPTHDQSRIWSLLDEAGAFRGDGLHSHVWEPLLRDMIRPRVLAMDGVEQVLQIGVPTGSAIQPPMCNLYLTDLDRLLEAVPGGFYARYGDDLIFLHPDPAAATAASDTIDREIERLELCIQPHKRVNQYFTLPGRVSPAEPSFAAISHLEHLGCRVDFRGGIGLKTAKAIALLRDLRARTALVLAPLQTDPVAVRLQTLCEVINAALDPFSPLCQRSAQLLYHVVDDRRQLQHLDYLIARDVAVTVSGLRGVRAFRQIPWRTLRQQYGLCSLVDRRNRMDTGGRP